MSQPNDHGTSEPQISEASGYTIPDSPSEIRVTKKYSTGNLNLISHTSSSAMAVRGSINRQSLDAHSLGVLDIDIISQSSILPEQGGEHGLGQSGLRRIRQQPSHPPNSASTNPSRSGSLTLPIPPNQASMNIPTTPTSPSLNFSEDLNRFPTESLHSFSFAHQTEDLLHNRQNVLKRSIDFVRDKFGWAASNPGLASAQARLTGDAEVQNMMELLARAQLIGEDAHQAHGLGIAGPLTGPADLSGANVFDKSFGNMHRSESPESVADPDEPHSLPRDGQPSATSNTHIDELALLQNDPSHDSLNKATMNSSIERDAVRVQSRAALKRTFTNLDDLALQHKLAETLAQPYSVNEEYENMFSPKTVATVPGLMSPITAHPHIGPRSTAPHGHGSRWTPAAQAIFTTEANTPWTITAANDLACLVFGVTKAEVRKMGILEVVKEERRKWLEEKLRDPEEGSMGRGVYSQSQRASPSSTTTLNVGNGITARLLSKPSSRQTAANRRSKTEDGSGGFSNRSKLKGGPHHQPKKSRGVLLCGDVVPIQKRNGALGSASLWVKEKKGGLIWVLEEIAEDVAYVGVDEVGCVTKGQGAIEAIWGSERVRRGMDVKRLIPDIPRIVGTNTGALDYELISALRTFTARTANSINIPVTVEQLSGEPTFRVSSFPHIAGIMVLNSYTLKIQSSNTVFSSALFGQAHPEGLYINDILPGFDKVLNLMTDEDKIRLVDGIVIPEHSFRRARALLAMREGKTDVAAVFLRPSGLPATHRDGSEIMVDVQMRVVKSERSTIENEVIAEEEELHPAQMTPTSEVVYALWITYSRDLHAANHGVGPITPLTSRSTSPPRQPSPGQSAGPPLLNEIIDQSSTPTQSPVSLLTQQLKSNNESKQPSIVTTSEAPTPDTTQSPDPPSSGKPHKKTINDFVVLEDMGQGAYGQVKLCRYKKNGQKKVVIKYVTKRRILVDTWTRDRRLGTVPLEIHVLDYLRRDGLKHSNIVEMSDFFEDDVNYYIEMVPHGLPGMDLFDYIELRVNMDEDECRKIFVQVAEALWHLHVKAKVVHRDIKDENVVLDGEGYIKLIDFGSAAYIKNGPFDVFVGTIDYAAPEVLAGQSYRGKEQDVWALGILLYTIIYKENPFYSIDEIMDHDLRVPYVMSEASIDLIRLMLNRDVDQRITISEVLEHRWSKGEGAEEDVTLVAGVPL